MKVNGAIIDMKPRNVTMWRGGDPQKFENVTPQLVTPERAREIMAQAQAKAVHGPWSDQIQKVITPEENAYFLAVWDAIARGTSTFMTAFFAALNNEVTDTQ